MIPKRNGFHYALIACGLVWLSTVLWMINSNAVLREIRLIGAVAEFLDKLPEPVNTAIFLLLWLSFLLGWLALLAWGAKSIIGDRSK